LQSVLLTPHNISKNAIGNSKTKETLDLLSHCLLRKAQYFNRGQGQRECFNHKNSWKRDLLPFKKLVRCSSLAYGKINVKICHRSNKKQEKCRYQHQWLSKHEYRVKTIVYLPKMKTKLVRPYQTLR